MLDRLEDVGRRSAHALGGAVGGDEVRKARLELAELAHEGVVLGVGDLGPRLDVVQIVVVVNLLAQLHDALRGVGPRHARSITFSAGSLRRAVPRAGGAAAENGADGPAVGLTARDARGRLRQTRRSRRPEGNESGHGDGDGGGSLDGLQRTPPCCPSWSDVILPNDRSRFRSIGLHMPRSSTLKIAAETRATTASVQDYLAAIYDLASSGKPVIGARLAKHMGISAPAVTEAIHRLARGGSV